MDLVNAYLVEVGQYLPRDQRDDIVGELRDDILEQVSDLAEQAGREPKTADERQVLDRLGHPLKVASGYSARRYLIGPALYPAYLKTLKTTLGLVLALVLLLWIAMGADAMGTYSLKGVLNQLVNCGFWVVVCVTAAFLVLEASGEKLGWYESWSSDQLRSTPSGLNYTDLVINLLTEGGFLLVWNSLVSLNWGADPDWLASLTYNPVFDALFWPFNIVVGGFFLLHVVLLVVGVWERWSAGVELLLSAALVLLLASLLMSGALIGVAEFGDYQPSGWVNNSLRVTLICVVLVTLWDAWAAYKRWISPGSVSA